MEEPMQKQRFILVLLVVIVALAMLVSCEKPTEPNIVASPVFDPFGGTYWPSQNVSITCSTIGASIVYTTDGSNPTSSSTVYTGPIAITSTTTLKAQAYRTGWTDSPVVTAIYTIQQAEQVSTPVFDPVGGPYSTGQTVTITCATSGATIRYTTDGTEPGTSSAVYNNPIHVNATTTIRAKGLKAGWIDSATASATYIIGSNPGQMILVPGGAVTIGDTRGEGNDDELPTHSVTLSTFYIGKYEVSQAEYSQFMQPSSSWTSEYGLGDNYPAYYVSWYSILKYCNLRSMAEGLTPVYTISGSTNPANWGAVPTSPNATWDAASCNWSANGYRLPTEAEWEYAARAKSQSRHHFGDDDASLGHYACYDANARGKTCPVGQKLPNAWGLHDMLGNVWEWCQDWYGNYPSDGVTNPTGPSVGSARVFRGGAWNALPRNCRSATRSSGRPGNRNDLVGFRLVLSKLN